MSDEQAEGQDDCRNDVFSLGVIWYQLLVGDFSRRIPHGWEDNLRSRSVPEPQIKLLGRCVRSLPDRPANGSELGRAIDAVVNREEEIAAERAAEKASQEQRLQQLLDNIETADCHTLKYEVQGSRDLIVSVMDGVTSYSDFGDSGEGWYNAFLNMFKPSDDLEIMLLTHGKDTSAVDSMREKARNFVLHWLRIGMKYLTGERKR